MSENNQNENIGVDPLEAAYKRFGVIMTEMQKALATGDKARIVHLGESFMEHGDDVITYAFDKAGVTEDEISQFGANSMTDSLLVKMASKPEGDKFMRKTAEADSRRD